MRSGGTDTQRHQDGSSRHYGAGSGDGAGEGTGRGWAEGLLVGGVDGDGVGTGRGRPVGEFVGRSDGAGVGASLGSKEGLGDELSEGDEDGSLDGMGEGSAARWEKKLHVRQVFPVYDGCDALSVFRFEKPVVVGKRKAGLTVFGVKDQKVETRRKAAHAPKVEHFGPQWGPVI